MPLSPHLKTIELKGKTIYLLGTAHVSRASEEEVSRVIAALKPDGVAVELCASRHESLTNPDKWRQTDLFQVVRRGQAGLLLAHLVLSAFQRRLGEQLHIRPGAEMIRAMEEAKKHKAHLELADRDVQITLRRTWRALGWRDKWRLTLELVSSLVGTPQLSAEEVEAMKGADLLSQVMEEFAAHFPAAKRTLIDERDAYLAHKIAHTPGRRVVGVVGAGHMAGILPRLHHPASAEEMAELEKNPPPSHWGKLFTWGLPAMVLGMIAYGFLGIRPEAGWEMVKTWVLVTGTLGALGAAAALAHPLTIVSAFLAAPITTLHPLLAAGWVAGLVEALVHKPRVADFETLPTDVTTFRGFWRNGIVRVLLVVTLTNIGASLGTFLGIPLLGKIIG
ncbi:MAG: TraB/GumN family protein [Deltaproteobacteria bacterium]|nr:TraB/GumN family protein [Deltaproteobacteria bacterium]